jgi:hypothetical protein
MYGVSWSCAADYLYYMCGSAKSRLRDYKGGLIRVTMVITNCKLMNRHVMRGKTAQTSALRTDLFSY